MYLKGRVCWAHSTHSHRTVAEPFHVTLLCRSSFSALAPTLDAASGRVMIFAEEPLINEARVVPEVPIQFDDLASL